MNDWESIGNTLCCVVANSKKERSADENEAYEQVSDTRIDDHTYAKPNIIYYNNAAATDWTFWTTWLQTLCRNTIERHAAAYILQKCGDQPYLTILILLVNFSNYSVLCVVFRFELAYCFAQSSVTALILIVVLSYVIPYVHWRIQFVVSHKECAWMSFQVCYIKANLLTFSIYL